MHIAILLAVLFGAPAGAKLDVEQVTLDNGLTVLLLEDHTVPLVAVDIWYHVGSRDERPGRTGFAHLFEHLMFQGAKHHDGEFFAPLQMLGAQVNGSTSTERTNYWEVLPSEHLGLALWMEADRMGYLPDALTQEKLDNQRDVVKNERRQNYENRPYGEVGIHLAAALYPEEHPYHWLTIGSQDDLTAASLEDVKAFFKRYYCPANATLAIAGDFDRDQTLELVRAYFGPIPGGEHAPPVQPPAVQLTQEKRLRLEDRVALSRLYVSWHSPAFYEPGDADLDVLADVLAGDKNARLYRRLVHAERVAQNVMAYQASRGLGSTFNIVATLAPGRQMSELEAILGEELAAVVSAGPTEREVQRSKNNWEARYLWDLEDLQRRADVASGYFFHLGDANYLDRDLQRYRQVSTTSVMSWAGRVVGAPGRVVIEVHPAPGGAQ